MVGADEDSKSGPPGPGARMETGVSEEEYTDPNVNQVILDHARAVVRCAQALPEQRWREAG
eukprot:5334411-Amphidinium_carterae.1